MGRFRPRRGASDATVAAGDSTTWSDYLRLSREQAATRIRWLAALGIVAIVGFSIFDLVIDTPAAPTLRTRLLVNATELLQTGTLIVCLTSRRLRSWVFTILFVHCSTIVLALAYSIGIVSATYDRLAFLDLFLLGLAVIIVQWYWPWQLALGALVVAAYVAVTPIENPDVPFFLVALAGAATALVGASAMFVRWRYQQYCTEAELRRASQVKSEFLGTMSHELRTPINIVVGYSDLLREGAMGPITEEQHVVIGHIARAGRHLLGLVESTLNVSRLEAGRMAVDIRPFALQELTEELRADVAVLCEAQGSVPVYWEVPSARIYIETDQLKLKEIILNLVGNAIKFTDRGDVSIALAVDPSGWLRLRVADTGVGIPAERLSAIFESFEQLHRSRPTQQGGVGLGLYIVKKLVELLQGTIEVDSTVGTGSEFRVRIPIRRSSIDVRRSPEHRSSLVARRSPEDESVHGEATMDAGASDSMSMRDDHIPSPASDERRATSDE